MSTSVHYFHKYSAVMLKNVGSYSNKMVDSASAAGLREDFGRESLQLNKDLERMTEQMENISVHLTWMAYDIVVLRTDPQLAKSLKRLEDEYLQCKAVICGSTDKKN